MNKELVLYSAGLDSYFMKEYLLSQYHNFECIYYDIGSKYSKQEIETIKKNESISIHYDFINLKFCEQEDAFIPNRNFLLALLIQSMYYDCSKIYVGGTLSDRVNDNNKEVFDELSIFLSKVHKKNIEITSPFWGMYKTDVIKWFLRRRENDIFITADELLNNTFSCYTPKEKKEKRSAICTAYNHGNVRYYETYECMNCPACFRKSAELNSIGIFRRFENETTIKKYQEEFSNQIIQNPRSEATLNYIEKLDLIP